MFGQLVPYSPRVLPSVPNSFITKLGQSSTRYSNFHSKSQHDQYNWINTTHVPFEAGANAHQEPSLISLRLPRHLLVSVSALGTMRRVDVFSTARTSDSDTTTCACGGNHSLLYSSDTADAAASVENIEHVIGKPCQKGAEAEAILRTTVNLTKHGSLVRRC